MEQQSVSAYSKFTEGLRTRGLNEYCQRSESKQLPRKMAKPSHWQFPGIFTTIAFFGLKGKVSMTITTFQIDWKC